MGHVGPRGCTPEDLWSEVLRPPRSVAGPRSRPSLSTEASQTFSEITHFWRRNLRTAPPGTLTQWRFSESRCVCHALRWLAAGPFSVSVTTGIAGDALVSCSHVVLRLLPGHRLLFSSAERSARVDLRTAFWGVEPTTSCALSAPLTCARLATLLTNYFRCRGRR